MREAAASIVVGSLESETPNRDEIAFFAREKIPGFTIFKRNISAEFGSLPDKLITPLYEARNENMPLFIAIDQEGGRVSRLPPPFPNEGCAIRALDQGSMAQQALVLEAYGKRVAQALLKLRINVNFAPVVDILSNPINKGIGDRAFGVNSSQVIARAGAFLTGMQSHGVMGCLKHFPGQGSEISDPHHEKVVIDASRDTLFQRELAPYPELMPLAKMVMVSHCTYPQLDPKPASLSQTIISGILKDQLKFTGLVVCDDMNMKAIAQDAKLWQEAIIDTVVAGSDLILVCSQLENWRRAIDALEAEARRSVAFAKLLQAAAEKVRSFRQQDLRLA